jgi:protein-L-isoaspartate(D-aspartate) O-methyltransferase
MDHLAEERARMVETQIVGRHIDNPHLVRAMRVVPREAFVAGSLSKLAYADTPLPIEAEQTISQPFIVAMMIAAARVEPGERVLEIGTGSGYAAAVLAEMGAEVFTVERKQELCDTAAQRLASLGYGQIHVRCGDGTLGWMEHAPYAAILVSAGSPQVPQRLLDQLDLGGHLVIPVGDEREQRLVRVERLGEGAFERDDLGAVRFVPLIGAAGWSDH